MACVAYFGRKAGLSRTTIVWKLQGCRSLHAPRLIGPLRSGFTAADCQTVLHIVQYDIPPATQMQGCGFFLKIGWTEQLVMALQLQGHRVAIIEKNALRGRNQEWNISRQELQVISCFSSFL